MKNKKLVVSLFGDFSVTLDGEPVPLRNMKAKALLAYLLIHASQTHSRETLMTLLWPDSLRQSAQTNLRQTLHYLRQSIPAVASTSGEDNTPLIIAERQTVHINPSASYELDTDQFDLLIQDETDFEKLSLAAAVYRDAFLHDIFLPDSNEFEAWIANQRALYLRQVLHALDKVTTHHLERRAYDSAVQTARQQLAIDDLRETAVCQLMTALAKSGRRIEALAACEQLRQRLDVELGVEPSSEITALLHQIQNDELPSESERSTATGQPAAENSHLNNLPQPKTALVGRAEELATLGDLFDNPRARLITLLGPGGIGKTRLALQASQEAVRQPDLFPDGVFLVDLANVSTTDQLVVQVATALNLSFSGILPPQAQIAEQLKHKKLLLFLDNFEQLVAVSADFIEEWLQQLPQIKILVTSREPLNLIEEWVVKLEGLAFPTETAVSPTIAATQQLSPPDDLTQTYPAVALFVSRARQVDHTFSLKNDTAAQLAVRQICQLLEGVPLGIELAAPWVRLMSCADIVREIQKNIDFLASNRRNQDPRHRSMRAVIAHSWMQLTAVEQTLLAQLSMFKGHFQREAALTVCQASLFSLAALVDKSLVQTTDNHTYRLHPLLQQFADEKLSAEQRAVVGEAHASYYAAFLEEQTPHLGGADQTVTLNKIEAELENIKAAWNWQIRQQNFEQMAQSYYAIYSFHSVRGRYLEGKALFETAVNQLTQHYKTQTLQDDALLFILANVHARLGEFYYALGQLAEADNQFKEGIYFSQQLQLDENLAYCYHWLGNTKRLQGYFAEAEECLRQALALLEQEKERHIYAFLLMALGTVAKELGQMQTAQTYLNKSLWRFEQLDYQFGVAHALRHLGTIAFQEQSSVVAQEYFERSLNICREIDDKGGVALALNQLGRIKQKEGEYEAAQSMYQAGLELGTESQEPIIQIRTLKSLGNLLNVSGDYQQANQLLRQALHQSAKVQAIPEALHIILEMAEGYLLQDQTEQALPLMKLALHHPASSWEIQEHAANLQHQLPANKMTLLREAVTDKSEKSLLSILKQTIEEN